MSKRQVTLLTSAKISPSVFSPYVLRNAFNSAFASLGISQPVVSTVSLSTMRGNLTLCTMPDFDCEFLIKHSATLASVLVANKMPSLTSVIKNENWYKVLVHGIPFRDFDTPTGMQLILDEIKTFNSGLTPIGTPYWATSREKRLSGLQLAGLVVVVFPNES